MSASIPWVEKYRPKSLNDVVSHSMIIQTIKNLLLQNELPHLLFYGPPGTGKTSTILAIANHLYRNQISKMVLDLNASEDRGIEIIRQEVQDFSSSRHIFGVGTKLVIMDECDAMTKDAQFALRRVIEKYTLYTRFCLICNYCNKIIPALLSRCAHFRFSPLGIKHVRKKLMHVIEKEQVKITDGGIEAIIKLGEGDMRRSLNMIQSTHMASTRITEDIVYTYMGKLMPNDINTIVLWLLNAPFTECFSVIEKLKLNKGTDLCEILSELQPFVLQLDISKLMCLHILISLHELEQNLINGANDKLQLASLVGTFVLTRVREREGLS
jgi:replication factor C subunit 3/5